MELDANGHPELPVYLDRRPLLLAAAHDPHREPVSANVSPGFGPRELLTPPSM